MIGMQSGLILPTVSPWAEPAPEDCEFYHTMDFPNAPSVVGPWDIRGRFDEYVGHYPIKGKSVLDVGTATGFLAFSAEAAGARVTALDIDHVREIDLLPYARQEYYWSDRLAWEAKFQERWQRNKFAFWYAWHQYRSDVAVIYQPLRQLRYVDRAFDVVFARAILEHLADPVSAIGAIGRAAREAVIVSFTPMIDSDELLLRPITDLRNAGDCFTWWMLSRGLYRRIFHNIGFTIELTTSRAFSTGYGIEITRPTIIARRTHGEVDEDAASHFEARGGGGAPSPDPDQFIRERDQAIAELDAMRNSTSWKFTAPLRALSSIARGRRP